VFFGTTDPTYVSTCVRRPPTSPEAERGVAPGSTETADTTMLRLAVIISTRRKWVKLSSDLGATTSDPVAKDVFARFAYNVRTLERVAPPRFDLDRLASSPML